MEAGEFWRWFKKMSDELYSKQGDAAASAIQRKLHAYDDRLGVEIGKGAFNRELIITANGDPDAFTSAKELVKNGPACEGWTFQALKPPSGFDFTIAAGPTEIDASSFTFEPLQSEENPKALGIRVFIPDVAEVDAGLLRILRLAIATGIGEEAAALIAYVDVVTSSTGLQNSALPIQDLQSYIPWHLKRHS